jgi:mitochondrial chaperone BCS1
MWEILKSLKNMLAGRNEFASGGLLLMVLGGISVWLRAVPERIWRWIVDQTTLVITVSDDDAAFVWVKEWFLEQSFLKRTRRVDLDTKMRNERIAMIPAPGKHWFWYSRRPFEVWFSRTENTHERSGRRLESLTLRTLGRNRAFVERLVKDVVRSHVRRLGVQSVLYTYDDGWNYVEGYAPRVLESVILQPGEKEKLIEDMGRFQRSKQRYEELGVPYHRGYLFHGLPGTGKTSLVSALAAHFGLSIYVINLGEFNDRTLMSAVNQVPANCVLLFEDIDCMRGSQSRQGPNPNGGEAGTMSPGTKENTSMNGVHAPSAVLFVMTTNHVEKLDAALLRPGRVDYKLFLGKASDLQKVELYRRFFASASEREAWEFVEASRSAGTMAEFQGLLLALEQRASLMSRAPESHVLQL